MLFFFFTFSLGEGPTLLCGQSYPNSKYLFWKFRHVRGQWKNIFHFVFKREEFLRLLGTLNGNSIKCIFGKLSARKDRRLQKQGVIQVKLREKVGFSAWTRLVKHRLWLQHSVCMLLTVCSLGHTSKWLTKVEGCRIVWLEQFCERIFDDGILFHGNIPLFVQSCPSTRFLCSEHKDILRGNYDYNLHHLCHQGRESKAVYFLWLSG